MMAHVLTSVLSARNSHIRDKNIRFIEEGHKYDILTDINQKYTSVTTWLHSHFPKFDADLIIDNMMKGRNWNEGNKYWGKSKEEIKILWSSNNGCQAGTDLHYRIECFMNNKKLKFEYTHKELYEIYNADYMSIIDNNHIKEPLEWQYFINFVKDFPKLKPYRTEWIVYNEDIKLAGSIDMIYENPDGTLSIYDWKRSKEISRINKWNKYAITPEICEMPDSNFWHYALQLNTYKAILETKYDKKVRDLYLVRLHPDAEEKNYELIKVPDLSAQVGQLFHNMRHHL
jgi:ATP-dependent exoDNAse (exonuclease V) beta subunit